MLAMVAIEIQAEGELPVGLNEPIRGCLILTLKTKASYQHKYS